MPDSLPLSTVNFSFSVNPAVLVDFDWYWRSQTQAAVGSLITAIDANATALTVSAIAKTIGVTSSVNAPPYGQTQAISTTTVTITPGVCLTVDNEPMTVTDVSAANANSNYTLTVVRGASQVTPANGIINFPFAVPVVHAAGAAINVLTYFSPWEMIKQLGLIPLAQTAVAARGINSAIFQSAAFGQVQVTAPAA